MSFLKNVVILFCYLLTFLECHNWVCLLGGATVGIDPEIYINVGYRKR